LHDVAAGSFAAISAVTVQVVEGIAQAGYLDAKPQNGIYS
jgi:hypothetical protein